MRIVDFQTESLVNFTSEPSKRSHNFAENSGSSIDRATKSIVRNSGKRATNFSSSKFTRDRIADNERVAATSIIGERRERSETQHRYVTTVRGTRLRLGAKHSDTGSAHEIRNSGALGSARRRSTPEHVVEHAACSCHSCRAPHHLAARTCRRVYYVSSVFLSACRSIGVACLPAMCSGFFDLSVANNRK